MLRVMHRSQQLLRVARVARVARGNSLKQLGRSRFHHIHLALISLQHLARMVNTHQRLVITELRQTLETIQIGLLLTNVATVAVAQVAVAEPKAAFEVLFSMVRVLHEAPQNSLVSEQHQGRTVQVGYQD
jgi:hypothetical protein